MPLSPGVSLEVTSVSEVTITVNEHLAKRLRDLLINAYLNGSFSANTIEEFRALADAITPHLHEH